MKHYCYLLLPEFSNLCLFNSIEPLRAANSFIDGPGYRWSLASLDGKPVSSSSGFEMKADFSLDQVLEQQGIDAFIVMASYNYKRHCSDYLVAKLRQIRRVVPMIGGLDSGSYALAKAGLLNDHKATIHWAEIDTFAEEFRHVEVCNNRYIIDGNRITAGGATTALDLMMSIIRNDFGPEIAISVSDLLIFDAERSEKTPQRDNVPAMLGHKMPRLARAIKLMDCHIEDPLSVAEIALQSGISHRQLERDFKNTLNTTASRYYSKLRVLLAQRLLTESSLSVTEIAVRAGYTSRASFNRTYRRLFNKSPSDERRNRKIENNRDS